LLITAKKISVVGSFFNIDFLFKNIGSIYIDFIDMPIYKIVFVLFK